MDAHMLVYENSNNDYIIQVNGKLIEIQNGFKWDESGYIFGEKVKIFDSQNDINCFIAFAEKMGINEHTVLGAKITLKLYMMAWLDYGMMELDEAFMTPQADYLAFINQTLSVLPQSHPK